MLGIEHLTGTAYAAAIVAVVVVEALALNAGYAVLARLTGPTITAALTEA